MSGMLPPRLRILTPCWKMCESACVCSRMCVCECVRELCVCVSVLCAYLWAAASIFDLAGVEALLLRALRAGEHACAAEPHRVDGAVIMETWTVRDDLGRRQMLVPSLHHYGNQPPISTARLCAYSWGGHPSLWCLRTLITVKCSIYGNKSKSRGNNHLVRWRFSLASFKPFKA